MTRALAIVLVLAAGCMTRPRDPGPPPLPSAVSSPLEKGVAVYRRGRYEHASRFFREALAEARARDDARAVSQAAYHLGLSLAGEGRDDDALRALIEAERAATRAGTDRSPSRIAQAEVLHRGGQTDGARRLAEAAARAAEREGRKEVRLQSALVIGRLDLEEGRVKDAERRIEEAGSLMDRDGDPRLRAGWLRLSGEALEASGRAGAAAEAYDEAADAARRHQILDLLPECLARAGLAHAAAGDDAAASDRLLRAATSAFAQGRPERALSYAEAARAAADRLGDEATTAAIEELLESIGNTLKSDGS